LPLINSGDKNKIVVVTNIGWHLPSFFPPFQVTFKDLIRMDRHQRNK